MNKYFILISTLLIGCSSNVQLFQKYPGTQAPFEFCHEVWDIGYKNINIKKCEEFIRNPKYLKGSIVKMVKKSGYNTKCKFTVVEPVWSPIKNESTYRGVIECPSGLINNFAFVSTKELLE